MTRTLAVLDYFRVGEENMSEIANQMNGSTKLPAATAAARGELFVINLCASMTPMPSVPKHLKGLERYKLYQVARVEDGRHRYRLRLGFFNSEPDAELVLSSVRSLYPAAFAGCATHEDMRYTGEPHTSDARHVAAPARESGSRAPAIAAAAPTSSIPKPAPIPAAVSAAKQAIPPTITAPIPKPVAKPITKVTRPAIEPAADEMSFEFMPTPEPRVPTEAMMPRASTTPAADNKPFHVARGINLPKVDLEFAPESLAVAAKASTPVSKPSAPVTAATKVAVPATKPTAIPQPPAPAMRAPTAPIKPAVPVTAAPLPIPNRPARIVDDYIPILDTTLTIRTLTVAEIEDSEKPKWFAVQLALSEHPFNLEAMPRLDIFVAYRLYSVVVNEGATVKHALRLGFFREEVSADAVSGYLKTFFPTPIISRVSIAEYDRFVEPKNVVAAEANDSKVVKLSEKREPGSAHAAMPDSSGRPTFGVTPAPAIPKARPTSPASHGQQNAHRGTGGKAPMAAVSKGGSKSLTDDSAIRHVSLQRPQSFFSKLIGRELD